MGKNLGKKEKEMLPQLNRNIVLKFTVYTIINICDLRSAAKQLYNSGQYSLSRSLAVFAKEELGKLVICIFFLSGRTAPEKFIKHVRSHHHKQALGMLWAQIVSCFDFGDIGVKEAFTIEADTFSNTIKQLGERINTIVDKIEPAILEKANLIKHEFNSSMKGATERTRQQGIYVSLELQSGILDVQHPRLVTQKEASDELDSLEQFMKFVDIGNELWSVAELDALSDETASIEKLMRMLDETLRPEIMCANSPGNDLPQGF